MKRIEAIEGYVVPNRDLIRKEERFGHIIYNIHPIYIKPTGQNIRKIRLTLHEIEEKR